jgi:hypothetical protein
VPPGKEMGSKLRIICIFVGLGLGAAWPLPALAQPALLDPVGALGAGRLNMNYVEKGMPKYHGLYLDKRYRLQLEQSEGLVTVRLQSRVRPEGAAMETYNPETGEMELVYRLEYDRDLVRIRSEVLIPAAPNYVRNPGQHYRVTVEGLTLLPDYTNQFEASAYDVLNMLDAEARKFEAEAQGIEGSAVRYGFLLASRALNESGFLPAVIPLTVLRSKAGQFRIGGETLGRRAQGRLERFTDVEGGAAVLRELGAVPDLTSPRVSDLAGPGYRRGSVENVAAAPGARQSKYRPTRQDLKPPDPRKTMMRGPNETTPRSERIGARGRAITVPEVDYPAVGAAQIENMELLRGESEGIMTQRMAVGD